MLKVLNCIGTQHDVRLVVVAGLICFAACFTAFRLYSRMRGAKGVVRGAWLLLTGLVAGSGVWATHFIAMVAYDPGLKTGYSPTGTLLSLMIAVLFMAGGSAVAPMTPVSTEAAIVACSHCTKPWVTKADMPV